MTFSISPGRLGLSWRGAFLRALVPTVVFWLGYLGLAHGAGVSERSIPASPLHWLYYALGLFVMGGLDLGTPNRGPWWAQALLWAAFFGAPAVTASALVEVLWVLALPMAYRLRRLRDHTIVVGGGRLAELYLQRLRVFAPQARIIVVDRDMHHPRLQALVAKYPATVVTGDINSEVTLALLQLPSARRVLLLTGNDFTNLNAAYQILERAPDLAGRIVLHLGNLGLLSTVTLTRAVQASAFFNSHEIAARQLVRDHLQLRLAQTAGADLIVFAGFGRFGQCTLHALQEHAPGTFERVVILDRNAETKAHAFDDRVGFGGDYTRHIVPGDMLDCRVWSNIDQTCESHRHEPLIIVGSDEDMVNLEVGLWLRRRYPNAYIVVRQFRRSVFSAELAREADIVLFAIADLITAAIPPAWCGKERDSPAEVVDLHGAELDAP
jgi:hypothetical protein